MPGLRVSKLFKRLLQIGMRIEKFEHEVEHQVHDAYKAVEHAVDAVVHTHHHTRQDPSSGSPVAGVAGAAGGAGSLSRPQSSKSRKWSRSSSFRSQGGGASPAPAAGMPHTASKRVHLPHTASKRVNLPHTASKGIKSRIVEMSSGVAGVETRVIAELSDAIDR